MHNLDQPCWHKNSCSISFTANRTWCLKLALSQLDSTIIMCNQCPHSFCNFCHLLLLYAGLDILYFKLSLHSDFIVLIAFLFWRAWYSLLKNILIQIFLSAHNLPWRTWHFLLNDISSFRFQLSLSSGLTFHTKTSSYSDFIGPMAWLVHKVSPRIYNIFR